jgi:hypothetical protein
MVAATKMKIFTLEVGWEDGGDKIILFILYLFVEFESG